MWNFLQYPRRAYTLVYFWHACAYTQVFQTQFLYAKHDVINLISIITCFRRICAKQNTIYCLLFYPYTYVFIVYSGENDSANIATVNWQKKLYIFMKDVKICLRLTKRALTKLIYNLTFFTYKNVPIVTDLIECN